MNRLPLAPSVPINSLSVTPSNILIGTGGGGLIEFDKATREFHGLTEADGLLMNSVGQAEPAEDAWWIAYRSRAAGGLGKLDLRTRKITSFTPSLFASGAGKDATSNAGAASQDGPPRVPVLQIAPGRDGEVWFAQPACLRRFRSTQGLWETVTEAGPCWALALAGDKLLVGRYANRWGRQDNQRLLGRACSTCAGASGGICRPKPACPRNRSPPSPPTDETSGWAAWASSPASDPTTSYAITRMSGHAQWIISKWPEDGSGHSSTGTSTARACRNRDAG